jgi:hypothetical protein
VVLLNSDQHARRMQLYHCGMSDGELAKREGVTKSSILGWRRRMDLPSNGPGSRCLSTAEHAKRRNLHRLGWSDARIARACGLRDTAIQKWRESHHLAPNFTYGGHQPEVMLAQADEDRRMTLYRRGLRDCEIAREVGRADSSILQWRARRGLPKNEHALDWERPPTSFVSLDAERGEGGFTLHGLVADDTKAEWLEENGATTW